MHAIGSKVVKSNDPWSSGGRVEQIHGSFDNLYGVRGLDGHLYWKWSVDFSTDGDLFAPL